MPTATATKHTAAGDKLVIRQSALPLIPERADPAIRDLVARLSAAAAARSVHLIQTELFGHISPQEGNEQLVIRQRVALAAQQALEYWDTLEAPLTEWHEALSAPLAAVLITLVSVEVYWE